MNVIIERILSDPHSAQWFINFAFQSLLVLCAGWLIARWFKKKAAALRSGIILTIMTILLLLPLVSVMFQVFDMPYHRTFLPFSRDAGLNFLNSDEIEPGETAAGRETRALSPGTAQTLKGKPGKKATGLGTFFNVFTVVKLVNGLAFIWLLGFMLLLFRLLLGFIVLKRFKRSLTAIDHEVNEPLGEILQKIQKQFPGMSLPGMYTTGAIYSPVVLGIFKPILVIPGHLFETLSRNELKSILLHELSHIYHKDQLIGVLQRMVTALHWWNPTVYKLSEYFSRAREEISDNYALMEHSSREYAECLINLAEKSSLISRMPLSLGMALPHIPMKERILHILSKERIMDTKLKNSTTLLIGLIAIILTGFIIGHSWTFALGENPEKEQSQADPVEQRAAFLNNLAKTRHYPAKMMATLETSLPADTRFTEITFSQKKLSIAGETLERDNITKFLQSLKDGDMFQNLELIEQKQPNREKPGIQFQVNALYKEGSESSDKKTKNQDRQQDPKTDVKSKELLLSRLENRLAPEKEIAPILRKLQGMITASKLKIFKWATLKEGAVYSENSGQAIYYEVPVIINLHGNLHQLALFFKNVSELEKFAVIDELKIKPLSGKLKTELFTWEVMFKISFYIKSGSEKNGY
jgi:beta-lactamase regulating signal transducer with metallopeptidase domain